MVHAPQSLSARRSVNLAIISPHLCIFFFLLLKPFPIGVLWKPDSVSFRSGVYYNLKTLAIHSVYDPEHQNEESFLD
jgi:hypothetical protein